MKGTDLNKRVNNYKLSGIKSEASISHSDVIRSEVGLLCQGKSEYEGIEDFRGGEPFFGKAMRVKRTPSSATLRQRLDQLAEMEEAAELLSVLKEESAAMLRYHRVELTPTLGKRLAVDLDVSPFDNSKSSKEGVGRTYKGYDGYAPMFAYLGQEGYQINTELRPGKQHCQKETPAFLKETLRLSRRITDRALLVRMDSGNDALDNIVILHYAEGVDYIVKRNLRRESKLSWWERAKKEAAIQQPRAGKKVYRGNTILTKGVTQEDKTVILNIVVSTRCLNER